MAAHRLNSVARFFAQRRFSHRQAMTFASARQATPEVVAPDPEHVPTLLFVQSFQSGGIVPDEEQQGRYTVTLEHGLGQTIYFSDRPDRIVGAMPTPQFLDALGFTPDNPPNAALVVEAGPRDEDIAVVELFNPRYDTDSNTATYDIEVLQQHERVGMTFAEQTTDLATLHPTFGTAHLLIDGLADCPDSTMHCAIPAGYVGTIPAEDHGGGWCWAWGDSACFPCEPWREHPTYFAKLCNQRFPACNGQCVIINYCSAIARPILPGDICNPQTSKVQ